MLTAGSETIHLISFGDQKSGEAKPLPVIDQGHKIPVCNSLCILFFIYRELTKLLVEASVLCKSSSFRRQ